MSAPPGLAVLISGGGRTLLNLADRIDEGDLPARIALVVASRECPGADRARERGLPVVIAPGDLSAHDLDRFLLDSGAGCAALAGYLRLLRIPPRLRNRVINIHPALLPSFGGPGMYGERVHRAVLDAGCKVSGCTAHLCDDRYDAGPIVAQAACEVLEGDTPASLGARVFDLECRMYPAAVRALVEGRIAVDAAGLARVAPPAP